METTGLFSVLDNTAFPGGTLSVEERAALQASFVLLKETQHLKEVRFWGKVRGIQRDYLVCQGTIDASGKLAPFDAPRLTFKSLDGVVWTPLAEIGASMAAKCAAINEPFIGDLGKIYGEAGEAAPEEGGEVSEDTVTEEKRLGAFVQAVDDACAVVPKGALLLDARHRVVPSPSYRGLPPDQAMDPACYVHWRNPTQGDKKKAFDTKGLTQTTDFLDTIGKDQPAGCWSMHFEPSACLATLRHHIYPGFVAFASMTCPVYGHVYFGSGLRNDDLAFMLPGGTNL
jgi:radial spoke head protein 9